MFGRDDEPVFGQVMIIREDKVPSTLKSLYDHIDDMHSFVKHKEFFPNDSTKIQLEIKKEGTFSAEEKNNYQQFADNKLSNMADNKDADIVMITDEYISSDNRSYKADYIIFKVHITELICR